MHVLDSRMPGRKWLGAAWLGAALLMASGACAADLPVKAPAVALPGFSWTGFYAGVNLGGGWYNGGNIMGDSNVAAIVPPGSIVGFPTPGSNSAGISVGGLAGYNYQIGRLVVGAETDINYIDIKSQRAGSGTACCFGVFGGFSTATESLSASSSSKVDWFGTARVRLGFVPVERLLVYATGGLAYGGVQTSERNSNTFSPAVIAPRLWLGDTSDTKLGWTAGAGGEFALTDHLIVRGEYLYVDLGTSRAVGNLQGTALPASLVYYAASRDTKFSVARAALSYKF
ncbi:outer membrane beta-barrel protein [Tardiphaga sp.]|uniref:outer membrane protein n=1 Tax=Tardiphaga sp. TaxID=1926292 RepID=UPI002636B325|nr:outer membrane beta-barrel protein [Tardiphaga sp.]MDB5620321.1 hypothetical protein [Tardiphaga sp.]